MCHLYLCLPKTPSPCNPWSCLVGATAQIGLSEISLATWAVAPRSSRLMTPINGRSTSGY
jgi:hypothetical protein